MLTIDITRDDQFVDYAATSVVEATPERAVVQQPAARFLDNHVGVRHASALYTGGYAAARALLAAALGDVPSRVSLCESSVDYVNVGRGDLTFTAERIASASGDVEIHVIGADASGKTVTELRHRWRIGP